MKTRIATYTFNAAAKTVTLTGITVALDRLYLIVNVTDGIIIYNFADPTLTATAAGSTFTLAYNTTTMSNGDSLLIVYDDAAASDVVSGTVSVSGSVAVTGPLTDTQLRASAVPVSGPLTDTQLRATPVPVSGTVTITDGSGPVTVDGTVAVSGTTTTKETRSSTGTNTSPSVTTSNTSILASNANRLGATIYNEAGAVCNVKLGATASATSYTTKMGVDAYYEVPFGYTGAIDGICPSGTATLRVTELT